MITEEIDPQKFAAALAARLDAVTPPGWSVWAKGNYVHWGWGSGNQIYGDGVADALELSPYVLEGMQDELIEFLGELWPPNPEWRPGTGQDPVHREWVRLQHTGVLELGYGSQDDPAIVLEPIDLNDCAP